MEYTKDAPPPSLRNPMQKYMGLRTDWGLIVLKSAEVLPMVADLLTVVSFFVLCIIKLNPVISQIGRCAAEFS